MNFLPLDSLLHRNLTCFTVNFKEIFFMLKVCSKASGYLNPSGKINLANMHSKYVRGEREFIE